MGEITRLGIIGIGGFGLFCLDKCRYIPGLKITGIADINEEHLQKMATQFQIPYTTTDWMELIENPEVDVLHIATPPSLHAEQGLAAVKAGKHVFMEKPLTVTSEEADELLKAAEENGVRVGIDFVMRYSTLYENLKTIINEQLLGKPLRFYFENNAKDLPNEHWFWDPWLSGGIPVEHGVHFFDIFASLLGNGKLQWAGRLTREGVGDDKWLAVLTYRDHLFGSFYHGFDKPAIIEKTIAELEFERGRVSLYGWIPETMAIDAIVTREIGERLQEIIHAGELQELPESPLIALSNGEDIISTHRLSTVVSAGDKLDIYGKAVQDAMADFIRWCNDSSYTPRVTGEDGRTALEVALAVTEMARKNG